MKIKENHVISVLVVLIIVVIWSKFTVSSGYGVGQAGTAQTLPTINLPGKDINITKWTTYGTVTRAAIVADTSTTKGVAIPAPTAGDLKIGPGDLNRQGWAATTAWPLTGTGTGLNSTDYTALNGAATSTLDVNTTNFQFAGFRKQLQPGGGGQVWYLFTYSGNMPSGSDYLQDQDAAVLLTVGSLSIPKFVTYLKSSMSPFPDSGCVYVVASTGACSVSTCTTNGGTAIQTLKLVKAAVGTGVPCLAGDQTTDLALATSAAGVATTGTSVVVTATGAGATATTPAALTGAGAFNSSATAGTTQLFYATKCFPTGCSGATSGFLANSGTVVTIAGTGSAGTADGVGINGSLLTNLPASSFTNPALICASGTAATVSNVVVVGSGHTTTTVVLRDMFKETVDKPPLWQVATRTITIPSQSNAPTISGITIDDQSPPTVYVADSANNKIYKITNFNGSPTVSTWTSPAAPAGLWSDSAPGASAAGTYLYALAGTNLYVIPVGTATGTTLSASNMMIVPTLTGTPKQLVCSGVGVGGTCYYTDLAAPANALIQKFAVPAYALGNASAPTVTQWGGGGSGQGKIGAKNTGNLMTPGQITLDGNGNLYVANKDNHGIVKLDTGGNIFPFTGPAVAPDSAGTAGTDDTGGSAGAAFPGGGAKFSSPQGLAMAPDGITFFVADTGNNNIRIIT